MPEVEWRMEVEQEWVEWVEMERKQGGGRWKLRKTTWDLWKQSRSGSDIWKQVWEQVEWVGREQEWEGPQPPKDHICTSESFLLFLVLESSVLSEAHLKVMRGYGERQLVAPPSLERGQKAFQKHVNALLSSKEPDPRIPSDTTLSSRASHSVMHGDGVKNFQSPTAQGWLPMMQTGDTLLAWSAPDSQQQHQLLLPTPATETRIEGGTANTLALEPRQTKTYLLMLASCEICKRLW